MDKNSKVSSNFFTNIFNKILFSSIFISNAKFYCQCYEQGSVIMVSLSMVDSQETAKHRLSVCSLLFIWNINCV